MPTPALPSAVNSLLRHWWVLVIRGLLVLAFGILAALLPQATIVVLVALFATFVFLDGIVSLCSAVTHRDWGWQLFGGLLSIAVGILTIMWPVSAGLAVVILIAVWAIARGVFDIAAAVMMRGELARRLEWALIVSGAVSIVFGLILAMWPVLGVLAIVGLIAGFAIVLGITLIAAGIRQRSLRRRLYFGPTAGQAT